MGLIQETRRFAQHKAEPAALFSIPDESTAAHDEDDDEGDDIIKSINSLLDQGKLGGHLDASSSPSSHTPN
jgi:hypothetical protein